MKINGIDIQQDTPVTLHGTVVFLRSNIGSKSEADVPYLYVNRDEMIRLFREGENPFENCSLKKYDGTQVQIKGLLQNKIFKIFDIEITRSQQSD